MTSTSASDSLLPQQQENSSNMKISSNTQIVIENNSDDITISKCQPPTVTQETSTNVNTNALPLKAQVLPLVYIQKNAKIPFATKNRPNNNNFIFSPISNANTTVSSISFNSNQNVIFAGRGRPLMLPKQPITIMPQGAKVTGAYVTMIKQVSKPSFEGHKMIQTESQSTVKPSENIVGQNGLQMAGTQPPKFVLTPLPKIQTNRLPAVTATTNSLRTKFTVLPMPVPQKDSGTVQSGQNVYNFQISDGKLKYSNFSRPVTILCDNKKLEQKKQNTIDIIEESNLNCIEKTEESNHEKNDVSNKTYELSIAEESLSNQSDSRLVVSSVDSSSSSDNGSTNIKPQMKFSHGVSILKKNIVGIFQDSKRFDNIAINNNQKSKSENDITIIKPSNGMEEKIVVTIPSINTIKPERERSRRKSQFSFRKDFDEMDITFPDSEPMPMEVTRIEVKEEERIKEETEIKEEKVPIMNIKLEDADASHEPEVTAVDTKKILDIHNVASEAFKLLKWEDNVGSLPGSNLKFILNEFNILEYLSEEDYQKILDKKERKAREKEDMEREVHCIECGCYGMRSDFINSDFCSIDCQEAGFSPVKRNLDLSSGAKKIQRRRFVKSKSDNDIKNTSDIKNTINDIKINNDKKNTNDNASVDGENSNDTSQDKFSYPWACKKKGFSWSKYLAHINAKAAPVKLFKDPFPYTRNGFKPGMKLEGVDPQHPSYFCVLTVIDTIGYRIRLHFDGYPENYDYWTYADSMDIFPIGWCEKYGHELRPPPGYTEDDFNWVQYLRTTKSTSAPKHLFANRAGQAICPNGFRIGMKLEAVDKKDSTLICVATIRDMMDNRILVHFDGWDDIYDYWVDPTSPYIHPVGWCDQYGHNLTPPSDYPTPETFSWETFLKETKSVAAPVRAFKQRSACGFKRGMRLECVDKRVPHLIRAATVDDVKEHQIRIHFDGWPDRYCYWVDDDCPDIHPVGWCQKTGHPIEPPLTPDDVYDFLECPTVGCRGQGHIKGLKYTTHTSQKYCPYADANIDLEKISPDRLLSPDKTPEARIPVSREPKDYKTKPRIGRPPKWLKELEASQSNEPPEKKPKRRNARRKGKEEEEEDNKSEVGATPEEKAQEFIKESSVLPVERESWKKHSSFLNDFINSGENPLSWSTRDVMEFVTSLPGCVSSHADILKNHQIDGESFLQLSQKDILKTLRFKVGPAVKMYNSIVLLRDQYGEKIN